MTAPGFPRTPRLHPAAMPLSIAAAIERILDRMPRRLPPGGCDRIIRGDPAQELRAIAVTFMATRAVLARAAAAGANFVVTHEPTFWNHLDETAWLAGDPVQAAKQSRIDADGQVLWRLHDHVHIGWPDAIATGMLRALGWEAHVLADRANVVELPPQPLAAIARHVRGRLGARTLRIAGDPAQSVRRVAFLPGACGGRRQTELLRQDGIDAVFCGESAEWETCEYVRDAVEAGIPKGLIVCGHAASEEAGMAHVADQIRCWFPEVAVTHLPTGEPFTVV